MDTKSGLLYSMTGISWPTIVLASILTLLLMYRWITQPRPNNLPPGPPMPPGPRPLPLIGSLYAHSMWPASVTSLRRRYGDVITVHVSRMRLVLALSHDVIREATIHKAAHFSHRGFSNSFMFRTINPHLRGVIESEYTTELVRNRNVLTSVFRSLGVGRTVMQDKILENAADLVQYFLDTKQKPFYPKSLIHCCVANVILHIALNVKFSHTDAEFTQMLEETDNYLKAGTDIFIIDRMPFLRFLPHFRHSYQTFISGNRGMLSFMWKHVQKHARDYVPPSARDDSNKSRDNTTRAYCEVARDQTNVKPNHGNGTCVQTPKDGDRTSGNSVISCLLDTLYNEDSQSLDLHGEKAEQLKYLLRDLILAGLETTATTLQWLFIQLANEPKLQAEIQDQIDHVVGKRTLRISDKLPLLDAFIQETLRYHTIAPVAPRHTYTQTTLGGYTIPANTTILLSLNDVHKDPETWGDPDVFRPARFLDDAGRCERHAHVVPFSLGRRACLGELLARHELFLFTGSLLQRLSFTPPPGEPRVSEEAVMGGTVCPKPFNIVAVPR